MMDLGGLLLLFFVITTAVFLGIKMAEAVKPKETRRCPFCTEWLRPEATVCRACGRDLPTLQADDLTG